MADRLVIEGDADHSLEETVEEVLRLLREGCTEGYGPRWWIEPEPKTVTQVIGDGKETFYRVDHDLGTSNVVLMLWRTEPPYEAIDPTTFGWMSHHDHVELNFASPPGPDSIKVVLVRAS